MFREVYDMNSHALEVLHSQLYPVFYGIDALAKIYV